MFLQPRRKLHDFIAVVGGRLYKSREGGRRMGEETSETETRWVSLLFGSLATQLPVVKKPWKRNNGSTRITSLLFAFACFMILNFVCLPCYAKKQSPCGPCRVVKIKLTRTKILERANLKGISFSFLKDKPIITLNE